MTHSGDWKSHFEKAAPWNGGQELCSYCDSTGIVSTDKTPADYWESGPITEDKTCEDCPECDQCDATLIKLIHPRMFVVEIPQGYLHPYPQPGPSREYIPFYFCGPGCFRVYMHQLFHPDHKHYNSKTHQLFRDFLYLVMSGQDLPN
jgi:hypothetical protein